MYGVFAIIFGALRLLVFNQISELTFLQLILTFSILIHRVLWIPLIIASLKRPSVCKYFLYYEALALIMDNILSFAEADSQGMFNFVLAYLLLISIIANAGLQFNLATSLINTLA